MSLRITVRMFLAGLLSKYETNSLGFEALYYVFCREFRKHTTIVFSKLQIYNEIMYNDDQWFVITHSLDQKSVEITLSKDLMVLGRIRERFSQLLKAVDGHASRDMLCFLSEVKYILTDRTLPAPLPSFYAAFGYIVNPMMRTF